MADCKPGTGKPYIYKTNSIRSLAQTVLLFFLNLMDVMLFQNTPDLGA